MGRRPKEADQKYVRLTVLLPPSIHQKLLHDLEFRQRWGKDEGAWTLSRLGRMHLAEAYGLDEAGDPAWVAAVATARAKEGHR
jgi:hypothetical protein